MVAASSAVSPRISLSLLVMAILAGLGLTSCGSSGSTVQKLSGNTSVTVTLSSTANDQLMAFGIGITGITLTNQAGNNVTLMSAPQGTQQWAEFIHVNGEADPFTTVTVPQDIYTAAAVTVGDSSFTCVTLTPAGGLDTSTFAYGFTPTNAPQTTVTVTIASPITITGDRMGLSLDLQVSPSATYSSCYDPNGLYTYSIQPTFNLSSFSFSTQPTNPGNGKVVQLEGQITAFDSTTSLYTVTLPVGPRTLSIKTDSDTAYQGSTIFSSLPLGTFVDMDGAIQPDGSLLASRVAVLDPSATDVQIGPAMVIGGDPRNPGTAGFFFNRSSQGADEIPLNWPYNVTTANFQISGQLTNLQSLPFVPSFTISNIVAGQNVYISTKEFQSPNDPYSIASTVTLMPQTIDGTVLGSTTAGGFTDYTVSLASYDLFPQLAVQQGQTTLLTNPSQVEVYVDGNTQRLNSQTLAAGSTLRFYGLVFNDNGTLRMDCAQVNDGALFTPASNTQMKAGRLKITEREEAGRKQLITTITRTR